MPPMDDIRPIAEAERLLRRLDRNGDGKLQASEWEEIPDPERADANADGEITLEELMAHPPTRMPARGREGFGRGGFGGGFGGRGGGFGVPFVPGVPGVETPAEDPEMRELMRQDVDLDRQAHELASRVRSARGEDRTRLREELAEIVKKHFEVRQKRRELQLKRMEEELKRLREAIGERNESRATIIDNRLRELLGESRNLEF
jgi:hypothetical protein